MPAKDHKGVVVSNVTTVNYQPPKKEMYQGIKDEHAIPDTSFCRVT